MSFLQNISQRLHNRFSKAPSDSKPAISSPTSNQTSNHKVTSTMSTSPVVLILGSGPRVGTAVSDAFAANGYKIAIAARKGTDSKTDKGYLSLKADFNKPDSLPALFEAVKKSFGSAPSVVVYNAAALTPPPDKDSALSIPVGAFADNLNVNVVSPYAAAQDAIKGWSTLPAGGSKLFIYTGNVQNQMIIPMPMMLNLGVGKAASAHWVGFADGAYKAQGYRFIYADERNADGKMKGMELDGPAHGEFYTQLAKSTEGIPWEATFVKGKGYVSFK